MAAYEMVIGLEVHVELSTQTKIFCGCPTAFGGAPNTHVCPVCSGMPGTLPVLNRRVVDYAIAAGHALDCEITRHTKFDRKNYFYPDLPKAYQISQLYAPICRSGAVHIQTSQGEKTIRIHEIHMEEDAGKLVHDPWSDKTMVDLNRCGVPLLEIVSEPDMRSAEEVLAYLNALRSTLTYLGVSDCRMQEGSMRADVNLSVRPAGSETLGTRTEMKNLNSLKAISRAIAGEFRRQTERLEEGKQIVQETRRWDDNKETSYAMRSKEDAQDYRYFPEPDLPPIEISDEWIERIEQERPEMRDQRVQRYMREWKIPKADAMQLTEEKRISDLFETMTETSGRPKDCASWIMGELTALMKKRRETADSLHLDGAAFGRLVTIAAERRVSRQSAREVLEWIYDGHADPEAYIEEHHMEIHQDAGQLQETIQEVLTACADDVEAYRAGNPKVFGYLVGQVMKAYAGKGDARAISAALRELLDNQ